MPVSLAKLTSFFNKTYRGFLTYYLKQETLTTCANINKIWHIPIYFFKQNVRSVIICFHFWFWNILCKKLTKFHHSKIFVNCVLGNSKISSKANDSVKIPKLKVWGFEIKSKWWSLIKKKTDLKKRKQINIEN